MKFYPYEKGGGVDKVLAILKGGHKKFWGSFYAVARSFSHIVGGHIKFPLFKRGGGREKFYPVLRGGSQKVLNLRFSHFVDPPPPPSP